MTIVLDYVTQPADFRTMQARGVAGSIVYIWPASWGTNGKAVTLAKVQEAAAVGYPLAFNLEVGTSNYQGGWNEGVRHGQGIVEAMRELGQPSSVPVFVSVDTDVPTWAFPTALAYFNGIQSVCPHPLGFYGENALGEYLVQQGAAHRLWQSESGSFPGNNATTPHVVAVQHFGWSVGGLPGLYDVSTLTQPDWGQVPRPDVPPPVPPQPPTLGDSDMLFVDEVHPGIDAAHPRVAVLQPDGTIILGNGASVDAPAVHFGNLTVVVSQMPKSAGWIFGGGAVIHNDAGQCIGFRYEAIDTVGQFHPYVYHFTAA